MLIPQALFKVFLSPVERGRPQLQAIVLRDRMFRL